MKRILFTLAIITLISTAFAQETQPPLISVVGQHIIKVEPDGATVNIMVSNENINLKEAKLENDRIVSKAFEFLRKERISEKDVRTTRVNLQPYKEYVKDQQPVQMFRAQQSITILVKDLSRLSDLLSGLVDVEVNGIQSVQFTSTRMTSLQDEARKAAMLDARRKATILAGAVGQKLYGAYTINDNTTSSGEQPRPMNMVYKSSGSMLANEQAPIAEGEIEITANVQVSFSLRP